MRKLAIKQAEDSWQQILNSSLPEYKGQKIDQDMIIDQRILSEPGHPVVQLILWLYASETFLY